jgi:hypothetical protein
MHRLLASLLLALALPACLGAETNSASPAIVGDGGAPCARCTDWLLDPGHTAVGEMCAASDDFAERVIDCATEPPGLGDCADVNLSRPPNPECLNQLHSECPLEIVDCEQDIDLL